MKRIHILHTNDLHSHFEKIPQLYSLVQSIRETVKSKQEGLLLVDVGDHLDRAMFETEGTVGRINRDLLKIFSYDVITFGNNELLTFLPKEIEALYHDAPFAVVSSNTVDLATKKRPDWLCSSKVMIQQGVHIGFLAVTIPFDTYYEQMGWLLDDPLHAIRTEVKKLRAHVDLLVVLSHVGIRFDEELANEVPEVDLILGGHTHHLLTQPERMGHAWISAAGLHGRHLGHIMIDWDEQIGKIQQLTGTCYPVDQVQSNEQMNQFLESYRQEAERALAMPVVDLVDQSLPISWNRESPLANLLADSLKGWTDAEIALVNSGQLLGDLPKGRVTQRMLHQICPHPINPVMLELTGAAIREILEESLLEDFTQKAIRGFGFRGKILGNIAVAGLQVQFDPRAPEGEKIQSIYFQNQPLLAHVMYRVATIDMLTFGVGYPRFATGKILKTYMPEFLRDLLFWQLKQATALTCCGQQRFFSI